MVNIKLNNMAKLFQLDDAIINDSKEKSSAPARKHWLIIVQIALPKASSIFAIKLPQNF